MWQKALTYLRPLQLFQLIESLQMGILCQLQKVVKLHQYQQIDFIADRSANMPTPLTVTGSYIFRQK